MKKTLIYVGFVVAIVAVWAVVRDVVRNEGAGDPQTSVGTSQPGVEAPDDAEAGYFYDKIKLGFSFPKAYDLKAASRSTAERLGYSIALVEKGYVAPAAGEGPTSITVDVFQNDLDGYTAESFAKGASGSNWKLGPGDLTPRLVGGEQGLEYSWSGLYEGKSVVVARPDFVYVFSVTWMSPEDRILADFDKVLGSVRFVD